MANENEKMLMELLKIDGNNVCNDCYSKGMLKRLEKKNYEFVI